MTSATIEEIGSAKLMNSSRSRRCWQYQLWIGIIAFNIVIVFFLIPTTTNLFDRSYNAQEFPDRYDLLASNLVEGHGYRMYPDTARTLTREPGYPIALAAIFVTLGRSFVYVKLFNVLLALFTAWIISRIAVRFTTAAIVTTGAPLVFLFHPGTLMAESRGGVETLFTFCITSFVALLIFAREGNRWYQYFVAGCVLGCAVLVKSTPLLFPILLACYLIWKREKISTAVVLRNSVLLLAGLLIVLSPWILRNYFLTRKFIPTATVLGISAHAGLYDNTHVAYEEWAKADEDGARERKRMAKELGYRFKEIQNAYYEDFYSTIDEVRFSDALSKVVIGEYREHPMLFVRNLCMNFFNLWFRGKTWSATLATMIVELPFLTISFIGMVVGLKGPKAHVIEPMLLLVAYFVAVYVVILAQARYSVPLIPLLSIGACITVQSIAHQVKTGPLGRRILALGRGGIFRVRSETVIRQGRS